jgi:hypothetical protein
MFAAGAPGQTNIGMRLELTGQRRARRILRFLKAFAQISAFQEHVMYTIPPYLPHEEQTGLFSMPQHWRGLAALITLGITMLMAGGAPSLLTLFFMSAPGLLAGAEFMPARLWRLRGWLRVASIIALAATVIFFGFALTQTRSTCTCKIRQIGSALS